MHVLPPLRRAAVRRAGLGLVAAWALVGGGCAPEAPPPTPRAADANVLGTLPWEVTVDADDEISTLHVEGVLDRAGLVPDTRSAGSFGPRSWGFVGAGARRAREALTGDPSWPEVAARTAAGPGTLRRRLEAAPVVLRDVTCAEAVERLACEHPSAVAVLRAPHLIRVGVGPAPHAGRSPDEELLVATMHVLDRTYLDAAGRRQAGCEVLVALRTADDRWGREWAGQVLADGAGWRLEMAEASAGDRRPRR